MNELDMAILKYLSQNCRTSYEEMARRNEVSPTTIKKYVRRLITDGTMGKFITQLDWSIIKARRILILVRMNVIGQKKELAEEFGKNPMIESVSCLNNGSFLIHAIYCDLNQFFQLEAFIKAQSRITYYEFHLLQNQQSRNYSFNKLERRILQNLFKNPRMINSELAKEINKSTKSVRLAIRRLVSSDSVQFTIQPQFHYYFVKINSEEFLGNLDCIDLPYLWDIFQSSSEPVTFARFLVNNISEVSQIRKWFSNNLSYNIIYEVIGEPLRYYDSIRTIAFMNILEDTYTPS